MRALCWPFMHMFCRSLKVWWHDATLFVYFDFITYIHSFNHNTFIRRHSLKPLSISSSLVCSVGKTSLWCRAGNPEPEVCDAPGHVCSGSLFCSYTRLLQQHVLSRKMSGLQHLVLSVYKRLCCTFRCL